MRRIAAITLAPMPGSARRRAAAAVLAAAALGLAGCGSGDDAGTIPQDDSEALLAALSQVQSDVDSGNCAIATTHATQFVDGVNGLPKEVGVKTKEELRKAGENLVNMTQDPVKCEEPDEETTTDPDTGASGFSGEDG